MERAGLIALSLAAAVCLAWEGAEDKAREGNELYTKGNFAEARKKYEEARKAGPKRLGIDFNMGNAYYREKEYAGAADMYGNASASEDIGLGADACYNAGNSRYRQGEAAGDPQEAGKTPDAAVGGAGEAQNPERMQRWEEALNAYKAAIELLVKNEDALDEDGKRTLEDARANYEFVKRKQEQEKQKQSQQPQQQPKDQQDKQQPKDQQPQGGGKDEKDQQKPSPQDQKQQDKDQQQQQGPQKRDQKEDEGEPQPKPGQEEQPPQQQEPKPEMSKEEAERLLGQIRDAQEDHRRKGQEKEMRRADPTVEKDW